MASGETDRCTLHPPRHPTRIHPAIDDEFSPRHIARGIGSEIQHTLRDLGITSIVNLTSSVHDYKGLSGFGIEIVSNEKLD